MPTNATLTVELVSNPGPCLVKAVHCLLEDEMAPGLVEDLPSLVETLSPAAGGAVPLLVCASEGPSPRGAVVGSYLPAVNVGAVLYSAVAGPRRGQGIYRSMRRRLIEAFDCEAAKRGAGGVEYVVSEQRPGSGLLSAYVGRWGAHEAALDYEQPQVQGLERTPLRLVFLPVGAAGPPSGSFALRVAREMYRRVYRIDDPDGNESFRRIVQSSRARNRDGLGP